MTKKHSEFNQIIDFIKTAENQPNVSVHLTKSMRKEVTIHEFTKWLKEQNINQFQKGEFNYYCETIANVKIQYRRHGWFIWEQ